MNPNDRVVHVRSSIEAATYWSRPRGRAEKSPDLCRGSTDLSPDFREKLNGRNTPFGRQVKPLMLVDQNANHLMSSRYVERQVFGGELRGFEEMEQQNLFVRELVNKAQMLEKENNTLKAQNAHLTKQLHASWKVMRAIANAMVTGKKL